MIQQETLQNGRIYTYSDAGYKIRQIQTNILYDDAVDVAPLRYTYEQTDQPIEHDASTPEELLNILLGGEQA